MTVEHLWFNDKIIKGESLETKKPKDNYEYDINDIHFDLLRKCAVMNSTAVFTTSLPNNIIDKLELIKKLDKE